MLIQVLAEEDLSRRVVFVVGRLDGRQAWQIVLSHQTKEDFVAAKPEPEKGQCSTAASFSGSATGAVSRALVTGQPSHVCIIETALGMPVRSPRSTVGRWCPNDDRLGDQRTTS